MSGLGVAVNQCQKGYFTEPKIKYFIVICIMADLASLLSKADLSSPWGPIAQASFRKGLVNVTQDYAETQWGLDRISLLSVTSIDDLDDNDVMNMIFSISRQLQSDVAAEMMQLQAEDDPSEVNGIQGDTRDFSVFGDSTLRKVRSLQGYPFIPPSAMRQMMMMSASNRMSPIR